MIQLRIKLTLDQGEQLGPKLYVDTVKDDSSTNATSTKAKVVSSADDKSDKEEETSGRTTRTKVITSNTNAEPSDKEEVTFCKLVQEFYQERM